MLIELDRTQMPSYELGLERGLQQGLEQRREQGLEQGLAQGREEERRSVALKLIELGQLDDQTIAEVVGLPLERVRALRREI